MRLTVWVVISLVAFNLAAKANSQTFRPIDIICSAIQFNPERSWENGKMVYHTPVLQIIDKGDWRNELTILWHKELAGRGFIPSRYAIAECRGVNSDPIGGVEVPWSPPVQFSTNGRRGSSPRTGIGEEHSSPVVAAPSSPPGNNPRLAAPSPSRAQLVDTPSGQILMTPEKKADYEAKLAEHKRQLAERERLITEAAAKHAANKAAAEAKQAQHERELAAHRDKVTEMEREAAARRAAWAAQSAAPNPTSPATGAREMTVRRVASIGGGASEEAARNNLLNGFYKQFGPITNVRCSYIIFNGRREWTCTGDQAVRKVDPQSASGQ